MSRNQLNEKFKLMIDVPGYARSVNAMQTLLISGTGCSTLSGCDSNS